MIDPTLRPTDFLLLAPEALGAALSDSAAWAIAFRSGVNVGRPRSRLTLTRLIEAVYGLSGPYVYSGINIPQFAAQGGLPQRSEAFMSVRRAETFFLTDAILGFQRHSMQDDMPGGRTTHVRFAGEDGVGRGVYLEMLSKLSAHLFSQELGLFEITPAGELEVNSAVNHATAPDLVAEYLRMAGRVMRLALRLEVNLGVALGPLLLKSLIGDEIIEPDLMLLDATLARSLEVLRATAIEELDYLGDLREVIIVQTFSFGQWLRDTYENPAGDIVGYTKVIAMHRLGLDFLGEVASGFGVHAGLSAAELRRAILGVQDLEITAWRARTQTQLIARGTEEAVDLFFSCLAKLELADRKKILHFWTGLVALPPGGFSGLSRLQLTIGSSVPKASTCYNHLSIPALTDEGDMLALLVGLISDGTFTDK